jgi:hypothetical protein
VNTLVLDDVVRFVSRFVVVSETQANTLALWTAHTHAVTAFDCTPYLAVTSPEKRSGKTRLLEVLELLVREGLPTANISDAALFRSIKEVTPTLLLDEVDAVFKSREREDLRGLLNAGYRRGAKVRRMGGARNTKLEEFDVFCAKAFAGIGNCLPDTILDRAITIRLQRKTRDEVVERFRGRIVAPEGAILHDRLADWVDPQLDWLHAAHPDLPDELDDRAQDIWEPLLAIADMAGGEWPERARQAALTLSSGAEREDDSLTARLLADVRTAFEEGGEDRLRTSDLIERLAAVEEGPWGEWYGKTISPQGLSKLLRPYRIKTMPVWVAGQTVKGYKREQFADAFHRVLGVREVREVRPGFAPGAAPNPPNGPNPLGTNGHVPTPGSADFTDFIDQKFHNGWIVQEEWLGRRKLHALAKAT